MHLEADGLLPCEEQSYKTRRPHSLLPRPLAHLSSAISVTDHAYWTFFMLIINRKYFTLAQANKIMKAGRRRRLRGPMASRRALSTLTF